MNKNLKAHNLTVKSFRGINDEIPLELKNITILKGENGTGKSSFVNAIEYLFSNELEFLKKRTIDSKKSSVHKDSSLNDVKIKLEFSNGDYILFENSKRKNTEIFDNILKNPYVKNASFILNRKKLLQFIDGTQGDRYDAVMNLCGMTKIDKIQSILSSSQSSLKRDLNNVSNEYNVKLSDLSYLLTGNSNLNLDDCINELNKRLKYNGKETIKKDTDMEEFYRKLDLSDYAVIANKIDSFNQTYEKINFDFNLDKILEEYELVASENLKVSQVLLKSLSTSKSYIQLTNSDKCPVCENNINPSEILIQISDKIEDINKNNSSFNDWKNKIHHLISDLNIQINNCKTLNEIIHELNLLIDNILPNFDYIKLINFKEDLVQFSEFNKVASDFANFNLNPLYREITAIKKLLADYETERDIDDLRNIYDMILKIKELKELDYKINVLNKQNNVSLKTLNVFTRSKENFIGDIISEIRNDVKTYYEYIHGNDAISSPDIQLTDSKLIDVYLNSFGDVVDSRSYASEGHLDTLAICIFLAFNKKFNDLPLIILDDVFTTVDYPHKERIARLLVDKFVDYQFIITTHSSLWFEQIKDLCNNSGRQYIMHEFIDWSLMEGPILSKSLADEEKILKYLTNDYLDFQAAGNAARRYLERTLTEICIVNNVKVPIRDRYDVGTLFDEARNHTLKAVKKTSLEPYYQNIWREIRQTKTMANILSHYNEDSDELPRSDVEKFCHDVINLRDAFTCICGKSLLKLDRQSKKLICKNPKCRNAVDMNSFNDTYFGFIEEEAKS